MSGDANRQHTSEVQNDTISGKGSKTRPRDFLKMQSLDDTVLRYTSAAKDDKQKRVGIEWDESGIRFLQKHGAKAVIDQLKESRQKGEISIESLKQKHVPNIDNPPTTGTDHPPQQPLRAELPPTSGDSHVADNIRAQMDELKQENKQLKDEVKILTALVKDLSNQIKELQESQKQTKETSGTKSSSRFLNKLAKFFNKIGDWFKERFSKSDSAGQEHNAENGISAETQEIPNSQPTKLKKALHFLKRFFRNSAKYTGLLRFTRTFPHRYRHNSTWGKIGKGTLEVLGGIGLAGGVYMIPFYIYKTAKYNHKDVMHQKYSKNGTGDRNEKDGKAVKGYYRNVPNPEHVLIYKQDGDVKKEFFIRPDAKDRELAFLTRHPIPNTEKGNEDYEDKKSQITKLTKSEVKALRKRNISETNDNSSEPNGWSVISMEAYKELRSKFPESSNQKEGEN